MKIGPTQPRTVSIMVEFKIPYVSFDWFDKTRVF